MKKYSTACYFLLALWALLPLEARPRFDERGNPLSSDSAASTPSTSSGESQAQSAFGERPQTKPKDSTTPAVVNSAENSEEEKLARQALRNPLTQVYFESAQLYLRSGRLEKALENLRRAQESGEDNFAREARLQWYYLRARRGEANLASEAEALDEVQRAAVLLRIADGYDTCAREMIQKTDCLAEAERVYAFLAELAPAATEGKLAALRLAQLLLDQNRQEAALSHLKRLLASAEQNTASSRQIPYDRAWFFLGNLYERPWYHRDTHKAFLAYQQVLKYPESPYHRQAKDRLHWLRRFALGK